jgi:hypothetical protein
MAFTVKARAAGWGDLVSSRDKTSFHKFAVAVTIHFDSGNVPVNGIFDNPSTMIALPNGGDVRDSSPELYLQDTDAADVVKGLFVTVSGSKWQVVKQPLPDGTGLTKLTLGHTNGETLETPTIRYRS